MRAGIFSTYSQRTVEPYTRSCMCVSAQRSKIPSHSAERVRGQLKDTGQALRCPLLLREAHSAHRPSSCVRCDQHPSSVCESHDVRLVRSLPLTRMELHCHSIGEELTLRTTSSNHSTARSTIDRHSPPRSAFGSPSYIPLNKHGIPRLNGSLVLSSSSRAFPCPYGYVDDVG